MYVRHEWRPYVHVSRQWVCGGFPGVWDDAPTVMFPGSGSAPVADVTSGVPTHGGVKRLMSVEIPDIGEVLVFFEEGG